MKRRTFIKQNVLAGAAFAIGMPEIRPPKDKLGVALVGLGGYSTGQLGPALQETRHCYLAGIVTGSPWKIPKWQEQYGIKDKNVYNYENMHTIADNDEIDIVYVVVPTGLHMKYSLIAANAGKHVWCEKPMAMTPEECTRIIDTCNKNKVKLSIGYRMQHEPDTQTIIGYASSKPYGDFKRVEAMAGYNGGGSGKGWRFEKEMGGGALYDMGVYAINGIRYATGMEPVEVVKAEQSTRRPKVFTEVDETTSFQLRFANGLLADGKTSVGQSINHLRVDCEDGWYELRPMQSYSGIKGRTSDGKIIDQNLGDQQARQMDDDALAIKENRPVMVPGEEGRRDIRIVRAILEAAKTGEGVGI